MSDQHWQLLFSLNDNYAEFHGGKHVLFETCIIVKANSFYAVYNLARMLCSLLGRNAYVSFWLLVQNRNFNSAWPRWWTYTRKSMVEVDEQNQGGHWSDLGRVMNVTQDRLRDVRHLAICLGPTKYDSSISVSLNGFLLSWYFQTNPHPMPSYLPFC